MTATMIPPLTPQAAPAKVRARASDSAVPRPKISANAPIIVATDGSETSDAAVLAAAFLARASGAPVQCISILEPLASVAPPGMLSGIGPDVEAQRAESRLERVQEQRRQAGGDSGWSVEIRFGDPAPMIARIAKDRGARLIVMGLNRHGTMDRVFGGDTVFDVVRVGEVPVLIVPGKMDQEPGTVVVGVDFGELSMYAAQLTLELFPRVTTMFLVHSGPGPETWAEEWYDAEYAIAADEGFARILDALGPDRVKAQTVQLPGRPARELVEFAEDARADLLVVGSYKRGLFRRLATGTLASRVLRAAQCPVLVVPEPPTRAKATASERRRPDLIAKLQSVTERNSGRRAVVEVDNPAIGAQALVLDYAFLGLDYDPTGDRLQLFLGDAADGFSSRHLTHTVASPKSVDVLLGVDGRDQVVRIADRAGQTLITFA